MDAQISSLIETVNQFCFVSGSILVFWSKLPPDTICSDSSDVFPSFKLLNHFLYLVIFFFNLYLPKFPEKVLFRVRVTVVCIRDHGDAYSNLKSMEKRKGEVCGLVCSSAVGCEDWDKATKENLVLCRRIPSSL